jgi:hypothetical protein
MSYLRGYARGICVRGARNLPRRMSEAAVGFQVRMLRFLRNDHSPRSYECAREDLLSWIVSHQSIIHTALEKYGSSKDA